jgi:hypothetical protein
VSWYQHGSLAQQMGSFDEMMWLLGCCTPRSFPRSILPVRVALGSDKSRNVSCHASSTLRNIEETKSSKHVRCGLNTCRATSEYDVRYSIHSKCLRRPYSLFAANVQTHSNSTALTTAMLHF